MNANNTFGHPCAFEGIFEDQSDDGKYSSFKEVKREYEETLDKLGENRDFGKWWQPVFKIGHRGHESLVLNDVLLSKPETLAPELLRLAKLTQEVAAHYPSAARALMNAVFDEIAEPALKGAAAGDLRQSFAKKHVEGFFPPQLQHWLTKRRDNDITHNSDEVPGSANFLGNFYIVNDNHGKNAVFSVGLRFVWGKERGNKNLPHGSIMVPAFRREGLRAVMAAVQENVQALQKLDTAVEDLQKLHARVETMRKRVDQSYAGKASHNTNAHAGALRALDDVSSAMDDKVLDHWRKWLQQPALTAIKICHLSLKKMPS